MGTVLKYCRAIYEVKRGHAKHRQAVRARRLAVCRAKNDTPSCLHNA